MTTCEYKEQCMQGKCKFYLPTRCLLRNKFEEEEIERMRKEASDMYPIFMNDMYLAHVPERFRIFEPGREI